MTEMPGREKQSFNVAPRERDKQLTNICFAGVRLRCDSLVPSQYKFYC